MRSILIPVAGRKGDLAALEAATAVSREFHSHLVGQYVRFDAVSARATAFPIGSRDLVQEWVATEEYEDACRARTARGEFERLLRAAGIPEMDDPARQPHATAEWREVVGEFGAVTVATARSHDLVVAAPPARAGLPRAQLASMLLGAGRPLLLAGEHSPKSIVHTIAIAWKNTREAAHAVTAAMPMLERARRVIVITAKEEGQEPLACVECAERLAGQLRWHGIHAESRMIVLAGRDACTSVIDAANEIHADLMVMGGYGHMRLAETIFGGFTHRVLDGTRVPVFMCH